MASFRKRGKTWQFTVSRMVNGKSKPIQKGGFKTKPEAQIAAAELEKRLKTGNSPLKDKINFPEYFEGWVATHKSEVAPATKDRYQNTLNTIKEHFLSKDIQDITRDDYARFLSDYGRTHAKESTRKLHTHIKACVKEALFQDYLTKDFTYGVKPTGSKEAKKAADKYLEYEDYQKLLRAAEERFSESAGYYALYLSLKTGLRFSEVVGLVRSDFDFKEDTLNVQRTWDYKKNRGESLLKTDTSARVISLDKTTARIFKDWFKQAPANVKGLVFYHPTQKSEVISNAWANRILKKLCEQISIKQVSFHACRHTHASVLLYKKYSVQFVSKRLGHKDINTTLRVYAHILEDQLQEENERLYEELA